MTAIRRAHRLEGALREQFEVIYRQSFPPEERENVGGLAARVSRGEAVLYVAREGPSLVGFALVLSSEVPGVYVLDYLAVSPACRNRGIGRAFLEHLRRVLGRCPRASGTMIEVESDEWGSEAERHLRRRRIAFYRRNGADPLPLSSHLRVPGMTDASELYSKLLWLSLGDPPPAGERLRRCIMSFFAEAYGMAVDDPLVQKALEAAGDDRTGITGR